MRRPALNFVVDTVALAAFTAMAATGLLLRYTLPPGSGSFTSVFGLDRHEWGAVHFWTAVMLLAVMALHVVLHWKWVVAMVQGRRPEASGRRLAIGIASLLLLVALGLSLLLAPVESDGAGGGQGARHLRRSAPQ